MVLKSILAMGIGICMLCAGVIPGMAAPPGTVTITCVGDIMLAAGVGRVAAQRDSAYLFSGVAHMLRADDLTIGNLECAVAEVGHPEKKQYTFRAHPALLPGLRASGIDAVSLANNHTLDYGRAALQETLQACRRSGLLAAGAGENITEAERPVICTAGTMTVALLAASRVLPSVDWYATARRSGIASAYDPTRLLASIRAVEGKANLTVVYLHWGKERVIMPERYQRMLARQCIDAGADLVVGSHPHVLQGFEYYRGKFIAYSLGNFVFTDRSKTTAMLRVYITRDGQHTARVIPCRIVNYRPWVISRLTDRQQVLRALQNRSFNIRIDQDGMISPRE